MRWRSSRPSRWRSSKTIDLEAGIVSRGRGSRPAGGPPGPLISKRGSSPREGDLDLVAVSRTEDVDALAILQAFAVAVLQLGETSTRWRSSRTEDVDALATLQAFAVAVLHRKNSENK